MSKVIPQNLYHEFMGYMSAHDDYDLPDGAWFQVLEDAAGAFLKQHKLKGDANDAAHEYLSNANNQQ